MKYLVGLLLGGLMEDPEPRFGNPYLMLLMKKLRENFTMKRLTHITSTVMLWDKRLTMVGLQHASQSKLEYALNEAKLLNNVQEKET